MEYGKSFTINDLEENQGRVVFSAPAGTGKTTAVADYIAKHWKEESFIFVSQTMLALDAMEERLLSLGLPKSAIFKYHSSSSDIEHLSVEELDTKCKDTRVVLITHSRLLFDSPFNYRTTLEGITDPNSILFIDESVNPIISVTMKRYPMDLMLEAISAKLPQYQEFSLDEPLSEKFLADYNPLRLAKEIGDKLCQWTPSKKYFATPIGLGITVSEGERSFAPIEFIDRKKQSTRTSNPMVIRRCQNLYYQIAIQIANRNFTVDEDNLELTIPISIPETWYRVVDRIAILDATGFLYKGFYKKFQFIKSENWNLDKINVYTKSKYLTQNGKYYSSLNKGTLTNLSAEELEELLKRIDISAYKRIYFVTFKGSYKLPSNLDSTDEYFVENNPDENSLMQKCVDYLLENYPQYRIITDEQYHEEENIIHLTNYGRTRGSNAFRNCDCVICLGNYRYDEGVTMRNIHICYPEVSALDISLANFIQEIYRSRIRKDEPIDVYSFHANEFSPMLSKFKCFDLDKSEEEFIKAQTELRLEQKEQRRIEEERKKFLLEQEKFFNSPTTDCHSAMVSCLREWGYISVEGIWQRMKERKSKNLERFFHSCGSLIERYMDGTVQDLKDGKALYPRKG